MLGLLVLIVGLGLSSCEFKVPSSMPPSEMATKMEECKTFGLKGHAILGMSGLVVDIVCYPPEL